MYKQLKRVAELIASLLSANYYVTQFARMVVRNYDNDCNGDIDTNGERTVQKEIVAASSPESVFFDVGANVGDWSVALVESGVRGRIIAVDPLSRNLAAVRSKLSELGYNNLDLIECALSASRGTVKFFTNRDLAMSGHDSLFDMREIGYAEGVDCVEVRAMTLDELTQELAIGRIHFLKIDVEGNELSVLKGAKALLARGAIDFIQIEFGHAARAARVYLHDIINFLEPLEYQIFVIKPKGLLPLNFTPFTENMYSYINFLIVKTGMLEKLNLKKLKR